MGVRGETEISSVGRASPAEQPSGKTTYNRQLARPLEEMCRCTRDRTRGVKTIDPNNKKKKEKGEAVGGKREEQNPKESGQKDSPGRRVG